MIKRIEFILNLDDPRDAAIYRALAPSLKYRRGGEVIRAALDNAIAAEPNWPYQMQWAHGKQEKKNG